jgi:hypothetical protein
MSEENAHRMLKILGLLDSMPNYGLVPPSKLPELLDKIGSEIEVRQKRRNDSAVRYELPRLEHLHVLASVAEGRGLGVLVAKLGDGQQSGRGG